MFDKIGDAAERLATNISRRAFLGRLGQGAMAVAAAVGGVLAFPDQAEAGTGSCCLNCFFVPGTGLVCSCYVSGYLGANGRCPAGTTKVSCKQYSAPPYNCPT